MSQDIKDKVSWSGKSHSAASKKKISDSRIEYLKENPDQVPYLLNHYSKGQSYPEQYWEKILSDHQVEYKTQKQVGRFRLDFAIGKVALEIDGEQHYVDARIVKSNARRDKELMDLGWYTIRVRWSAYKKLTPIEQERFRISLIEQIKESS